jgi:hypothetical protein
MMLNDEEMDGLLIHGKNKFLSELEQLRSDGREDDSYYNKVNIEEER